MGKRYRENASMSEYDPFAEIYDEWSDHMTEDVAFYVELARAAEGPIVELAVGNGRVAIPVAREMGRKVIGIDLSAAMLGQARERAAAEGVELELRQGDMRDLELEEPAGLVYSPFRSLLHMPSWQDRRRVFERVNRSEWEGLIEVAGLEVDALYGDFDLRPLGKEDREFIWVARKPE